MFPYGLLLINDIDPPGVPFVFIMFARLSGSAAERSGFSNDGTVLKKIGKHFGTLPWLEKENDFLVLNNTGQIIGRIVMRACSPKERPWAWTIAPREQSPSFSKNNHGYSESREQAMKEFQAQFSCVEFHRRVSLKK
jgi:hypothetical protein